jgi:fluoride exporter
LLEHRVRGGLAVIKVVMLVFVGGALGAMLREFLMLMVPQGPRGFPLDILVANLVAAFLLGLIAARHTRKAASDGVYALIGTGITGGLSTFSSFAYGSAVLIRDSKQSTLVAAAYVLMSLVLGYVAVYVGLKLGRQSSDSEDP